MYIEINKPGCSKAEAENIILNGPIPRASGGYYDFNIWNAERIRKGFALGRGTPEHLKQYARNNKNYMAIIKISDLTPAARAALA